MPANYSFKKTDVLCGKNKLAHSHCGNKRFRHLIEMNRVEYQTGTRKKKTLITNRIIDMIRDCEGRFLKLNEATGEWENADHHFAHEKVSHALRSAKDPCRPRFKKKRVNPKYIPTPEQDAAFEALRQRQLLIFEMLSKLEDQGIGESTPADITVI